MTGHRARDRRGTAGPDRGETAVDLFWISVGAGAHAARTSGRIYEAIAAARQHRRRCELYHSALEVRVPDGRYVVEQTPVPDAHGDRRGVVAGGAVAARWAGRFRILRYEIRRWAGGAIPDVAEAVGSPVRRSDDLEVATRALAVLPSVPTPVWSRPVSTSHVSAAHRDCFGVEKG